MRSLRSPVLFCIVSLMQQVGVVLELVGQRALIRGDRASTCGSCAGKSSCSTLGAWNQRALELNVDNRMGAKVGDEVVIEVPDSLVLKSAFTLYGLPMLLFFAAGVIAWVIAGGRASDSADVWAAVAGLTAVALYYLSGVLQTHEKKGLDAQIVHIQARSEVVRLNCHQGD